jgi:ribosomal protein S18 acetylase RimI-like enzyme
MIKPLAHTNPLMAQLIHQIFQVSYAIEADLLGSKNFPPLQRTINDIQQSTTAFYGYYTNDKLTGVIEIRSDQIKTHICSLTVDPNYFRQGIAVTLLEFALRSYPSALYTVETGLGNAPAVTLYENFGFIRQKTFMTDAGIEKVAFSLQK